MKKIIFGFYTICLLTACGSGDNTSGETSSDTSQIDRAAETEMEESVVDNVDGLMDIFALLQQSDSIVFPIKFDKQGLNIPPARGQFLNAETAAEWLLDVYADSARIICHKQEGKYNIALITTYTMFAKGLTTANYLITYSDKMNEEAIIDQYEWCGEYAVSAENPNGGSSAGQQLVKGEWTADHLWFELEGVKYYLRVDEDGKFVMQ